MDNDILVRIKAVNKKLLDIGYSETEIIQFWNECFTEAKIGKQLTLF